MISLRDGLPLVKFDQERTVAFRRDWLLRSVLRAAENAGYRGWWLAAHVTESVTAYLQLRFDENIVALPRLEKAVQSVLQAIGYPEIASRFEPDPPIVQISLSTLARQAGEGFELSFFRLLTATLDAAAQDGARYVEIVGLEPCVKHLQSQKQWSPRCARLREEIVAFVRHRLDTSVTRREILFSMS